MVEAVKDRGGRGQGLHRKALRLLYSVADKKSLSDFLFSSFLSLEEHLTEIMLAKDAQKSA